MISIAKNNCNNFLLLIFLWFILYYTMIDECCGTYMYLSSCIITQVTRVTQVTQVTHRCTVSIWFLYVISIQFLYVSIVSVPISTNLYQSVPVQRCYAVSRFREGLQRDGALLKPRPRRSHGHKFQSYPVLVLSCPILSYKIYTEKKGLRYISYISYYRYINDHLPKIIEKTFVPVVGNALYSGSIDFFSSLSGRMHLNSPILEGSASWPATIVGLR